MGAEEKTKGVSDAPETDAEAQTKGTLLDYFRVFKYGTFLDGILIAICLITSICTGAALPLMVIILGRVVNDVTSYGTSNTSLSEQDFLRQNNQNALYLVYIFIGKLFVSYISLFTVRISGMRISAALRHAYLDSLLRHDVTSIDKLSVGKVSHRITESANTIQVGISQNMAMVVQQLSFILSFYIIAFTYNPVVTIVACAVMPVTLIATGSAAPFIVAAAQGHEAGKEESAALAYEVFSAIRIIAAFGAESLVSKRHAALVDKATKSGLKMVWPYSVYMSPYLFTTYATSALTFWFGIRQYINGHVDNVGTLFIVFFSVTSATSAMSRIPGPILSVMKAASSAAEMFATLGEDTPDHSGLKDDDASASEDITFENVRFSYPTRPDVLILNDVSLKMEKGKTTAIVGPSGAGKSTVVGMLERWYSLRPESRANPETSSITELDDKKETKEVIPVSGTIRIGNHDIEELDLYWWRNQIGLVQQDAFLFNDTIFNNVAYGLCGTDLFKQDESVRRKLVEEACRQAYAHEFISKMPEGYDTKVGESGIRLSGGQRQRIAIARSIIKKPTILILDEATSALDVHSERIVQKALDNVTQDRTTIVIAHRLSTIKKADKIIVLRDGKVVEEGSHESLMNSSNGLYHDLVKLQELRIGHQDDENASTEAILAEEAPSEISETRYDVKEDKADEYSRRSFPRTFWTLMKEQRQHWLLNLIMTASAMVIGATYPLMAWMLPKLIEVFTLPENELVERGNFWSLMFFIMAIVSLFAFATIGGSSSALSPIVWGQYKKDYFNSFLAKPMKFFDESKNSPGTLTSTLGLDPDHLQQMMGVHLSAVLQSVFSIIGSFIISFVFGWKLALVGSLAVMPVILFAGALRMQLEMHFEKLNAEVFAKSSQFATEAVGAFRTVSSLTLEGIICDRYSNLLGDQVRTAFKKATWGTVIFATSDSIDIACTALVFWYGGTLVSTREYTMTQFLVVYMAAIQSALSASMWFSISANMVNATSACRRIIDSRKPLELDNSSDMSDDNPDTGASVEFKSVQFTYDGTKDPVLKNLNLEIAPGQFAALVGASGCGKSTTINLIERFYSPDSGAILFDGKDINTLNVDKYRRNISLVAQDPFLLEGSIRDNITLSVGDTEVSDAAVQEACSEAQIHDFITSLPEGYATKLGTKGLAISGGQKQRISLARALLRRPRLLLLDEATSSLDSTSEKQVQMAIEKAAGGKRTILAIAHRLATVRNADVIFVLGVGGVVEEKGTHDELIRKRGVYFRMCQAQLLDQ